ncbi:MAG: site-2 protease family protein [Planctomycetota bacterium]|jgi:Zn-dependent protease|nr:site-2 protease family protein [Planctomycetota bacterium]
MDGSLPMNFLAWYVVFLFSTSLHEAAHAVAASFGGDRTASTGGQATLNPIPHIRREKIGMIAAPILSFFLNRGTWMIGWASAPFNPYWAARCPKRSFVMSLAGPLAHLIPTVVSWGGMAVGIRYAFFSMDFGGTHIVRAFDPENSLAAALALLCSILFQLNLILCVFNLLPFPPMDGSEVWYLFLKSEESRLKLRHTLAGYGLAGLLLAWYVFPVVFRPILNFAVIRLLALGHGVYPP